MPDAPLPPTIDNTSTVSVVGLEYLGTVGAVGLNGDGAEWGEVMSGGKWGLVMVGA